MNADALAPASTPVPASASQGQPAKKFPNLGRAMVFLGVLILVADLVFVGSFPARNIPAWRLLSWKIDYGFQKPAFDPQAAQTTILIEVDHPGCTPSSGGDWLAPAAVNYTPWSVTITMSMNETGANSPACAGRNYDNYNGPLPEVGDYLTGLYVPVQLSEPLGGRLLFDGASNPPAIRPY